MVYMYMCINFTLMLSDSELGLPVYYSVCSIQFSNFLCILNGAVWPSYTWKSGLGDDPVEKKKMKEKKIPGISRSCGHTIHTTAWQSPNKMKVC